MLVARRDKAVLMVLRHVPTCTLRRMHKGFRTDRLFVLSYIDDDEEQKRQSSLEMSGERCDSSTFATREGDDECTVICTQRTLCSNLLGFCKFLI